MSARAMSAMSGRRSGVGDMERLGRRHSYLELFKACRLCGSGGGYKMPIVQASPPQHLAEPELRHKIRDCCSIDVRPNDKMPPLICELCVDKVNDFFEFREMCRATNCKVRASLGLPAQTLTQELSEDCILGVSGPVIYASEESGEPTRPAAPDAPAAKPALKRGRKKTETPRVSFQEQAPVVVDSKRSLRNADRAKEPAPIVIERMGTRKRERACASPPPPPVVAEKRLRFSTPVVSKPKVEPKKIKAAPPPPPPPKKVTYPFNCNICKAGFSKQKTLNQHLGQMHLPMIFSDRLGCSPCREWFTTIRLADDHHKWHKSSSIFYNCWRCSAEFKLLQSYNRHFALRQCIPEETIPDPVCDRCHKTFATENFKNAHRCTPAASVGNCSKCKRHFSKRIQLRKHEKTCTVSIQSSPAVNPNNPHLKSLKAVQVHVSKCDNLLQHIKREPVDSEDAFDSSANVIIKSEPTEEGEHENPLGAELKQEIKEEYVDYGDAGFQNDNSDSDSGQMNLVINPFARKSESQVESLSFISLRSIFSNRPFRKKQKIKRTATKQEANDSGAIANLIITSVQGNDSSHSVNFDSLISENVSDSVSERILDVNEVPICENKNEEPSTDCTDCEPSNETNVQDSISKNKSESDVVSLNCERDIVDKLNKDITIDDMGLNDIDKTIDKFDGLELNYDKEETDKMIDKLEDVGFKAERVSNDLQSNSDKDVTDKIENVAVIENTTSVIQFNLEKLDSNQIEIDSKLNSANDEKSADEEHVANDDKSTHSSVLQFNYEKRDIDNIENAVNDVENASDVQLNRGIVNADKDKSDIEKENTDKIESVIKEIDFNFETQPNNDKVEFDFQSQGIDKVERTTEDVECNSVNQDTDKVEDVSDDSNTIFKKQGPERATSALNDIGLNYDDDDDDEDLEFSYEKESSKTEFNYEGVSKTNDLNVAVEEPKSTPEENSSSSQIDKVDTERPEDHESNDEKPERDILDLVSDSGDDCNIIDSPDKAKYGEETKISNQSEESNQIPSDANILPSESETDDIIANICSNFVTNSDFSCDKNSQNAMDVRSVENSNADSLDAHRMDVDEPTDADNSFNFDNVVATDVEMAE